MYHAIVEKKLRASFEEVNRGNLTAVVEQFAPEAEHWFSGEHALGGRRQGIAEIRAWYDRLGTVLPDLRFEITGVAVSGMPWNTVAMVEWVDHFRDPSGRPWSNQGVHVVRLGWGRIRSLHIFCDTVLITEALRVLADLGRPGAGATPIGTIASFTDAVSPAPAAPGANARADPGSWNSPS